MATCYDLRSITHSDHNEALFDSMSATKLRQAIFTDLNNAISHIDFKERPDRKWVYATLANCSYALGKITEGENFESLFRSEKLAAWEIETFETEKQRVQQNR